ncbi:hypothetical protein BgiMline_015804 [Biomphalaria glabrata]
MESNGSSATSLQSPFTENVSQPADESEEAQAEQNIDTPEPPKTPETVVVEPPYNAPPINFIIISIGEKSLLVNVSCRKANFIDFVKKKCRLHIRDFDMCDLQGRLVGLLNLTDYHFVDHLFEAGQMYVPCELDTKILTEVTEVRPCFPDWEIYHPELAALLQNSVKVSRKGSRGQSEASDKRDLKKKQNALFKKNSFHK